MKSMGAAQSRRDAVGFDFGTTNSSIAIAGEDGQVQLASFPSAGAVTPSFRSVLYFEQYRNSDGAKRMHSLTGPAAIEHYLQTDEKGRLVQSLKSHLSSQLLTGTEVFGRRYKLEELISRILSDLRKHTAHQFAKPIRYAMVGRPVRFVGAEAEEDQEFAVSRLRAAFALAGFEHVNFEMEPVAAAYTYEATLDHEELILIGDFGGGTSDFSLLRVGPEVRRRGRGKQDLLGNSGVGLAGDAFDARIIRKLVSPALGSNSEARSLGKLLPAVPAWIYANLERWHYLSFLRTNNVREILKSAHIRALEPEKIEALIAIIDEDLGYQLHHSVQALKFELSRNEDAEFRFFNAGMDLRIPVQRTSFESWIAEDLQAIEGAIDKLLQSSGVDPRAIDRVFLTGGSSFVPAVRRIFERRFGKTSIRGGNEFTSVAHGLALRAAESLAHAG
ncbi:MAG: Hsp70 family protein [Terracidiphilus sp.]